LAALVASDRTADAQRHLAALERLERIIAAFASMVSHQTRTALVGIQGLSELIRDGDLSDAEVREYAGDIFGEALKIDAMIGEMFDLNRLETRQSAFRKARVDLNQVVEEAAAKLGLRVATDGQRTIVIGDPDRLRQALQRVLNFVHRAALPGSQIGVSMARQGDQVTVTIVSTESRSAEFEDWLYGRYERYEQRPSAILGAGVGLAVARAIVELHGGAIEADRAGECGAEFRLRLPVPAASAVAPGRAPAPTSPL
jgi:signal transduction histidine kinase